MVRIGFWVLALLWLPAGIVALAAVQFQTEAVEMAPAMLAISAESLARVTVCGTRQRPICMNAGRR